MKDSFPQGTPDVFESGGRTFVATSTSVTPTIFEQFCPEVQAEVRDAMRFGHRVERSAVTSGRPEVLDEGGARSYTVVPARVLRDNVPKLDAVYRRVVAEAGALYGIRARPSPYEDSSVTAKVYGGGDSQGWHLDTNPITGLLFLSDSQPPAVALVWDDLDGRSHTMHQHVGDLAIFPGRYLRHCVPVQPSNSANLMVLFNIYTEQDTWRPPEMDAFALRP